MRLVPRNIGLALAILGACTPPAAEGGPAPNSPTASAPRPIQPTESPLVAVAAGTRITLRDVENTARSFRVSPREALTYLEHTALLARAAREAGFRSDREVEAAVTRASVRALLGVAIETPNAPGAVPRERVIERHDAVRSQLESPETRRSTHALVRVPPESTPAVRDAARRLGERILAAARASSDPIAALRGFAGEQGAFHVAVESTPALRQDELDPGYAGPLFRAQPGLVPELAESRFGVHVIVLDEIVPAWSTPDEEWESGIRRVLATEDRVHALDALVEALASRTSVRVAPNVDALLAAMGS